jgi:nucleotide-binding universal stress UspA family protein
MAPEIHMTLLGALLAVVFAASMGSLLYWMFRVPLYLPAPVAKVRVSMGAIKRILVPALGADFAGREVELACRFGEDQNAEILLAYVLEVPRTLSLGAPLPEAEAQASQALDMASTIVTLHKLPYRVQVLRARVAGEEIVRAAAEQDIDMIVVGMKPGIGLIYENFARTLDVLLRKAPCELIIDRVVA